MKKLHLLLLIMFFAGASALIGCKKTDKTKPAAELIQKTWSAKEVKEAGTKVYDAASSTNTKDYSKFKLSFTATDVTLTEFNGDEIKGKWALTNNTTLELSSLNPQPTGVTGNLTYTNVTVTADELKMTRSSTNPKTGASSTDYVLK